MYEFVRFDLQISKRVLSRLMQKTILSPNSLEAGLYKISFHIGLLDTKICRKVAQAVLPN
jgi:hypothetical protein